MSTPVEWSNFVLCSLIGKFSLAKIALSLPDKFNVAWDPILSFGFRPLLLTVHHLAEPWNITRFNKSRQLLISLKTKWLRILFHYIVPRHFCKAVSRGANCSRKIIKWRSTLYLWIIAVHVACETQPDWQCFAAIIEGLCIKEEIISSICYDRFCAKHWLWFSCLNDDWMCFQKNCLFDKRRWWHEKTFVFRRLDWSQFQSSQRKVFSVNSFKTVTEFEFL